MNVIRQRPGASEMTVDAMIDCAQAEGLIHAGNIPPALRNVMREAVTRGISASAEVEEAEAPQAAVRQGRRASALSYTGFTAVTKQQRTTTLFRPGSNTSSEQCRARDDVKRISIEHVIIGSKTQWKNYVRSNHTRI